MRSPEDLATRLLSRPITPARVLKLSRHLANREALIEVAMQLEPEQAEQVWESVYAQAETVMPLRRLTQ